MRKSIIASAVAASLAASSAFALVPTTASYDVSLNIAGSSAFQQNYATEINNICVAGTLDTFNALATSGATPAMQAFSCTLNTNADALGAALSTKNAIIYARAEGGSAYGVAPIAKVKQINRLVVNSNCTLTATAHVYTCPVAGWNFAAETGTGNMTLDTEQVGITDVEPAKHTGANWPGGFFGLAPTVAELGNLTAINPVVGQVFGIYVNNGLTGGVASSLNLSKQVLTGIFQGLYSNWNAVPKMDGSGFVSSTSVPLKICNRDVGSGTRTGVTIYFNGYSCNPSPGSLANTGGLALNNSTGAELTCLAQAGTIGYASIQAASKTTAMSLVNINGVVPSVNNAASGQYDYWFEATFNHGPALVVGSLPEALALVLETRIGAAADIPSTNTALLALSDFNTATVPVSTSFNPVALGSHGGDSCALPK